MLKRIKTRLNKQPYFLFLLAGIALIISTFFFWGQFVHIHLHDTLFVISANYFIWALAIIFFVGWVIYELTEKILWTRKLIWAHVLSTLLVLIIILTIVSWHDKIFSPFKKEVIGFQDLIDDQKRERTFALTSAIVFILGQFLFFVNLIGGLFKRRTRR